MAILGVVGTLASSGPWGILALALGAASVAGGLTYLIVRYNKWVDANDMSNAGSDSGKTSSDLKNQLQSVHDELEKFKKEIKDEHDNNQS